MKTTTAMTNFFKRYQEAILYVAIMIAAIMGVALIIYATNYGPWAFSDSTTYIWTAINFAEGRGLVIQNPSGGYDLLTWHPPLFSLLLSIPIAWGADALQSARWLNALSFGMTIFLSGFATWRFTRSFLASLSVTALTFFALDLIYVFSGAMSEGIFFVLGFSALILLVEALRTSPKAGWMVAAGILAGLSYLARYTGIAFVGVVLLFPMLFIQGSFWKRLRGMVPAGLPAVMLPVAWSVFVFLNTSTFGGRSILTGGNLRLDFSDYLHNFWNVITQWIPFILRGNHILPAEWKFVLGVVMVMVILFIGLKSYRKNPPQPSERMHLLWLSTIGLFLAAYLGFHILSTIFSSAAPAVDRRLLSPILFSSILFAGAVFSLPRLFAYKWLRPFEWLFLIYALISILYFQGKLESFLYTQHNYGFGYTSKRWEGSKLLQEATLLDTNVVIASNNNAFLLFHTGRFPFGINISATARGEIDLSAEEAYLVLFRQDPVYDYGDVADGYLSAIRQYCDVIFEDAEGYICYWER
jgi:hypothetical protein